jgi:hypothetical protein
VINISTPQFAKAVAVTALLVLAIILQPSASEQSRSSATEQGRHWSNTITV